MHWILFFLRVIYLRCFHVNSAKCLRTGIFQNIGKWLLLKTMFILLQLYQQFPWVQSGKVNQKLRITFWKQFRHHRMTYANDLCSENTKFSDDRVFCFPNFMKTWPNLTKARLREACPWHSRSKIPKNYTENGLKLCKFNLFFFVF